MPQTERIAVGTWVFERSDTERQTGIAMLYIDLPRGLNAQDRTKACSVITGNFRRAVNVCIRHNQLVVKLIVSDVPTKARENDIKQQVRKLLRRLDSEISLKPHQAKRDRPRKYFAGMRG